MNRESMGGMDLPKMIDTEDIYRGTPIRNWESKKMELNQLACEYANNPCMETRTRLFAILYENRRVIFQAAQIRKYTDDCNPLYADGEFLFEALVDSFDSILDEYAKVYKQDKTFIDFFFLQFTEVVLEKYRRIKANQPVGVIFADPKAHVQCFETLDETKPLQQIRGEKRVLEKISSDWYKILPAEHKKAAYVRVKDVAFFPGVNQVPLTKVADDGEVVPVAIADSSVFEEVHDDTIAFVKYIQLLSDLQRLFSRGRDDKGGLSKYRCYKLFYTETLVRDIKNMSEWDFDFNKTTLHEKECVGQAEGGLVSFILENDRASFDTFNDIAIASLKKNEDFDCTCEHKEESVDLPLLNDIFRRYLSMDGSTVQTVISRNWAGYVNLTNQCYKEVFHKNFGLEVRRPRSPHRNDCGMKK